MVKTYQFKYTKMVYQFFILFTSVMLLLLFAQSVFAEGVFADKEKAQHQLSGVDLNRIKAEYQIRFGKTQKATPSYKSKNPWDKKKKTVQAPSNKVSWGECRDYAIHKRNRCYREGRDAYRCEQMYETRTGLCDSGVN
ncbi:hypothetical protein MNBD_GAMMA08-1656 [hydrothermal vent metagenome]|uniref:Uncharacterized protein n=1 Tax=hydrothermal vent metagenome TaxID=652676 RepID=A0A3B0XRN0_9ZZZZ